MKKLFIFLICFGIIKANGQGSLDTSVVRGLILKSGDLDYFTSYEKRGSDSTMDVVLRFIRAKSAGKQNNDNVTLDSLPGSLVVKWYRILRQVPAGEADAVGNNAKNAMLAITHPVVSALIAAMDDQHRAEFIRHRRIGKTMNKDGQ